MDSGTSKILSKILGRRELDKIPNESANKIENYFEQRFEEYLTAQALYEASQRTNGKYTNETKINLILNTKKKKKMLLSHFCSVEFPIFILNNFPIEMPKLKSF